MPLFNRSNPRAPTTIFATSTLSPRQIANKAITLGCKKLDRDDKRSRPRYHMRERLLLCNTIAKAEEVLNQRTRRTNRRVMAAEEDDSEFSIEEHMEHQKHQQLHHQHHSDEHSPLRSSTADEDQDTTMDEATSPSNHKNDAAPPFLIPSAENAPIIPRDCRIIVTHNSISSVPIATTII
ncbi:uncharacterized protein BYT42DRAFT_583350 [Radiomyces spectabilis]|uniref:uncharacterized protein n=1 Tax=Radiomyces spectabilis TaxID=64574 RepID=UPI002220A5DF|nr:uncharacterized protein BYT42DRAFT_583350 [Radiomyces spectabilis]KAI8370683.1 hypothetical protein BYT42DRAFT_583350 [Radiomyces spectabilis]